MGKVKNKLVAEDCKKSCTDINGFSIFENQTILVTGGTGFVGKWIAEMVSYVNETSSLNIKLYLLARDVSKFEEEVPHLVSKEYITVIQQDVRFVFELPSDINYIIHAAGSPDNREHVTNPLKTIDTFYKGTVSVMDAALRLPNLRKIVHMSSHQIYGKNEENSLINERFTGTYESSSNVSCYGESKRIAESVCNYFRKTFQLPVVVLRPFAFIGPYQQLEKPWAINSFIRDGILGGPIKILGNGLTERSYMYGSDMAYWILMALVNGSAGENYNLGSGQSISLNDLANKVKEHFGSVMQVMTKSSKEYHGSHTKLVPCTKKVKAELEVSEIFDIDEALARTILWNKLD